MNITFILKLNIKQLNVQWIINNMKVTLQKNLLSWISFLGGEGVPFEFVGNTINKESKIIILDEIIQFKDLLQSSKQKLCLY